MPTYILALFEENGASPLAKRYVRSSDHRKSDEADWEIRARELCRDAWRQEGRYPVTIEGKVD